MFRNVMAVSAFDTVGDLDGYRGEIEELTNSVGLPIVGTKTIGLEGLKGLINDTIQNHPVSSKRAHYYLLARRVYIA